ncbi:hypothetical protein SLEP1_g14730 [Rubroshorea leprosula]|uniref:Reverse transcriptase zinc-binding domain-containing protein n=1 Tax=Rubroshorea leprosula TaxID=152421 RepID=A0AAV5IWP2_9ROSI|nr:hypothetical protein SLEP1_g14730 [Rubroshorea leprosula]
MFQQTRSAGKELIFMKRNTSLVESPYKENQPQVNYAKLEIFCCGLANDEIEKLKEDFGFKAGVLPVRMNSWSAKHLSFAGRLQLITAVIQGITTFWCSTFILPKKVIREVERICAAFHGRTQQNLLGEQRRSFWAVKIPSNASWGWRKLLKLRQRARGLIQHIPGDGTETHLWHDKWHPSGPLVETYGTKIIQDAGIPSHAKLAMVVNGNYWKWPPARSPQLLDIQIALCGRLYPKEGEKDSMVWIPSASSSFKARKTWHWIRNKQARVSWHKLVWFPQSIPKHSFIWWLAVLDRLTTRARQKKWPPTLTDTCVLCNNHSETTEHLFFKCYYARRVWQVLSNLAGIPFMDSWQRLLMGMGKPIFTC